MQPFSEPELMAVIDVVQGWIYIRSAWQSIRDCIKTEEEREPFGSSSSTISRERSVLWK